MTAEPYRRFMILSSPRSGTHMLRTALGGHPAIVCHTEMFNPDWTAGAPYDGNTPAREILGGHIFRPYPAGVRAVGFVLHRRGAGYGGWPDLWDLLAADTGLHVMSLRRENMLRRYLSWRVMREPQTEPPTPKVMDVEELIAEFEQGERALADFDARFAGHPLMHVTYEALCGCGDGTLARIQDFLGVPVRKLEPETRPNAPVPLEEAIVDFERLAEAFAGTRWAHLFGKP